MKSRTAIISIKDLKAEALPALKQALIAVAGVEFEAEHTIVDDLMRAVLKAGHQLI